MPADYSGYLVADAHTVYDHLYATGRVTEVACWAHTRRYFFKTLSSEPDRAREALALIGKLFEIERAMETAPRKKREKTRQKHSRPIVERFFAWCAEHKPNAIEETPLFAALRYATNQKDALERFLTDGRLPLHNNDSERALRQQAIGRKNWLFVGSDWCAKANAVFTSLLASCKMHNVEPWGYLRDLFCLLQHWDPDDILALAPLNWVKTAQRPEIRQTLSTNPYRIAAHSPD